jgi:hypothetical protein
MSGRASSLMILPAVLLLLLAASASAGAQEPRLAFEGLVTTARGVPVSNAAVSLAPLDESAEAGAHRTMTDGSGRFRIEGVSPGLMRLHVRHIGFGDVVHGVEFRDEDVEAEIVMEHEPIRLEEVGVQVDRLENRLRSVPRHVRAFDRESVLASGVHSAGEFIRWRAGLIRTACGQRSRRGGLGASPGGRTVAGGGGGFGSFGGGACVRSRGRTVAPSLYIDERPAWGGMEELDTYPIEEIARVEVISRGAQIRVYTRQFMVRLASRPVPLFPIVLR